MKKEETRLTLYAAIADTRLPLDFADDGIKAGFPSPAQETMGESIDLNRELVRHPSATFYARASGDSMKGRGIEDGDLLVVDRSLEPQEGNVVVAFIDGEFTLKTLHRDEKEQCLWLLPANDSYEPIKVTEDYDFAVWGVVTHSIRNCLRP